MKDFVRQTIVVLTVAATIVVNILANALPLNGLNTGEISDRFKVYFVPAGYVFSIWGVIYIGLIAYAVFQALPSQRENPRLRQTGYLVAASGLANIAWLFLWHYEQFPLTLVAMFALLGLLIVTYLRLGTGLTLVPVAETWTVRVPFSIYLGWITVAAVANVTDVLYYINWEGFGISPEGWMLTVLAAVLLIAALVSFNRRDIAYTLVILWALVGIAVKHFAVTLVATASLITAALVAVILIYNLFGRKTAQK
ncbi:MAG TPA: TspO/MBR family protein [Bellilinea sp.]